MLAFTVAYFSLFGMCTGATGIVMECTCIMGKCMQARLSNAFFSQSSEHCNHNRLPLIVNYFCVSGLCTGAIGIVTEYIFVMGKCMQSRMCYLFSLSFYHCNHKCLPLRLLSFLFLVCVLEQ